MEKSTEKIIAKFFKNESLWRSWLQKNHLKFDVLWVGFYKIASGKSSITWPQSVDQALCFGWIDGLRKSIDDESYMIRFTPRRASSIWSAVNQRRIQELKKEGLVNEMGWSIFKNRDLRKQELYSFEQSDLKLHKKYFDELKFNKEALIFWNSLPPSTKKQSTWWVTSAKKEETRQRRMRILIECCEKGLVIPQLRRNGA